MKFDSNIMENQTGVSAVKILNYLFIIILLNGGLSFAQETLVPERVFQNVSHCILSGKYIEAERVMDQFIREYPQEPAGPLFKASVLQYECIDYEDYSRDDEFYKLLDETERLAQEKLSSDSNDLWAKYYIFAARGLRGVRASLSGRLIYGIVKGRSGAMGMLRIIEEDSTFYDAYLMAGSYQFWKSVEAEPFFWMPFISDERRKGISGVKTAISRGRLNGPLSNTVLLEMLLEHDPEGAAELAEKMVESYPSCRLFSWQLGEAYKKLEKFESAVRVFSAVAESIRKDEADDGSGELRCWWKLAVLSKSVGKKEECIYFCKKIINLGKLESVYKRQQVRIDEAKQMIEEFGNE